MSVRQPLSKLKALKNTILADAFLFYDDKDVGVNVAVYSYVEVSGKGRSKVISGGGASNKKGVAPFNRFFSKESEARGVNDPQRRAVRASRTADTKQRAATFDGGGSTTFLVVESLSHLEVARDFEGDVVEAR